MLEALPPFVSGGGRASEAAFPGKARKRDNAARVFEKVTHSVICHWL
jgi:hypothetical protein